MLRCRQSRRRLLVFVATTFTNHRVDIALGTDIIQPHFAIFIQFPCIIPSFVAFRHAGLVDVAVASCGSADLFGGTSRPVRWNTFPAISSYGWIRLVAELASLAIAVGAAPVVLAAIADADIVVVVVVVQRSRNGRWWTRSNYCRYSYRSSWWAGLALHEVLSAAVVRLLVSQPLQVRLVRTLRFGYTIHVIGTYALGVARGT